MWSGWILTLMNNNYYKIIFLLRHAEQVIGTWGRNNDFPKNVVVNFFPK